MIKPTILIGHGRFGQEVLQRLLRNDAPRGSLAWVRDPRGESGEHRLRDLALLHLPEAGEDHDSEEWPDDPAGGADFILDLYRQIRRVEARPGAAEPALSEALAQAADSLRAPGIMRRRGDALGGLDVIVVAHVADPAAIGALDLLTKAMLTRLVAQNPNWRVSVQSDRKLNCILILDFDNFRGPDPRNQAIRRALHRSMEAWKVNLDRKDPAIDRCYLQDGRAGDGTRDRKTRCNEVTLFLELLLFSGLRADAEIQDLYQQGSQNQQVAAAFGVRLMERSPQLQSRVAAARFGEGWLPYLRGEGFTGPRRPARRLAEALEPLLAAVGCAWDDATPLAPDWHRKLDALADELLALPGREAPDWPERAGRRFAAEARTLERELNRAAHEQVRNLRQAHLDQDGLAAVAAAIERDLHDELEPVPLAAVLAEVNAAIDTLDERPAEPALPATPGPALAAATAAQRRLAADHDEWIRDQGRALARFWPLLATVAGVAATPFARDLIRHLPLVVAPESPLRQTLVDLALRLDHPLAVAPLLILPLWLALRFGVQRRIVFAIRRAIAFHTDAARGRLSDAIRQDCAGLRELLDRVLANVRATLAADLLHQLTSIRQRLQRRDRELKWLHRQLAELLRLYGLRPGDQRIAPADNSVHMLVQSDDDLAQTMRAKPATPAQFQCRQEALPTPFEGWNAHYCDAFLDLFAFVDKLSRPYLEHLQHERGSDPAGAEWTLRRKALRTFTAQPGFRLGLRVDADKAGSQEATYCILPKEWSNQPEVRDRLRELGITGERIRCGADPSRVYLLKWQSNIALSALEPPR